jgi:hypothetical protein
MRAGSLVLFYAAVLVVAVAAIQCTVDSRSKTDAERRVFASVVDAVDDDSCDTITIVSPIEYDDAVHIAAPDNVVDVHLRGYIAASDITFFAGSAVRYHGPATIVGGNITVKEIDGGNITFDNIDFDGAGSEDAVFDHCLQNTSVTIINSHVRDWHGPWALCANASTRVGWYIDNLTMIDISYTGLLLQNMNALHISNSRFEHCSAANRSKPCVRINMSWDASLHNIINCSSKHD